MKLILGYMRCHQWKKKKCKDYSSVDSKPCSFDNLLARNFKMVNVVYPAIEWKLKKFGDRYCQAKNKEKKTKGFKNGDFVMKLVEPNKSNTNWSMKQIRKLICKTWLLHNKRCKQKTFVTPSETVQTELKLQGHRRCFHI